MRHATSLFLLLFAASLQGAVVDAFDSVAAWSAHPSDGVELHISRDPAGHHGSAMRLDFDFHNHAGYAIARRKLDIDLPPNFEFRWWVRAEAPVNDLEFKLIDASGDNVWWLDRRNFTYPKEWTELVTRKRQISFAWGPLGGGEPHHIASIEIVVTAGTGGKGTVWIDDLTLDELPPAKSGPVTRGPWQAPAGPQQWIVDLGETREIGAMQIAWDPARLGRDFSVAISRDGTNYETVREVADNRHTDELLALPDRDARFVRLSFRRSAGGKGYAIRSLTLQPPGWAETPNDLFSRVAASAPRGSYPRYLAGEQPYWTVVGADGADHEALAGEDGNVEPFKSGFSIEPFLFDGRLITWSDVSIEHSLEEGDLPIPSAGWKSDRGIELVVTSGVTSTSMLLLRYRVRSTAARDLTLFLTVRPFQVNPSTQFLNITGGVSPIRTIGFDGRVVTVEPPDRTSPPRWRIEPMTKPSAFGAATYDQGGVIAFLRDGRVPPTATITDPQNFASGALAYPLRLRAREWQEVDLAVPLSRNALPVSNFDQAFATIAASWREKLHRVAIEIPGAPAIADTIRSNLAWTLIDRDGAAIEPGSRSYDRAWIRDGALISAELLRLGHDVEAKEFAEWFAPYQFPNGKVPCCVDVRGADPVPENDSHGELIFLVAEIWRYTGDAEFVRRLWPHVDAAASYIQTLRAANHGEFEGLVTESISHEGYSAKPVHSYWDDSFALKGLHDAAQLAGVLGFDQRKRELEGDAASLQRDLLASMLRTIDQHHLDYLPASAELGDLDPSATAIAISPLGILDWLPEPHLRRTFDHYFASLEKPRDLYTPYE
ncbi:MAG: discoidin domain-containing protein, partial [Thermoanaerobaculia bacterium]